MIRVAINGFGRIGRLTLRALLKNPDIKVVAVNDLTDDATLAHLFKYDSVHGKYTGEVTAENKSIIIDGNVIYSYAEKDPANLPWKELNIDVVAECTGLFRSYDKAVAHIDAGAKRVVISAPAKSGNVKSIVLGVNDDILTSDDIVLSNASCTTNCVAPMIKVIDELYHVESGSITTVHAYTGDQRLHDAPHSDLRRARAAAQSIIPTTTGAAKAVGEILPHLASKLHGYGIRVPIIDGSMTDFTCVVKNPFEPEDVNAAFKTIAQTTLKGILEYTEDPIVSADIVGNTHSCIFDAGLTEKIGDNMLKIVGWYDNEFGYSNRLAELIDKVGKLL